MELAKRSYPEVLKLTIAEVLHQHGRASEVLKNMGMAIAGNEEKTLLEVCTAGKLNENEVRRELNRLNVDDPFVYPDGIFGWSPELVIRYLEEEHHQYTRSLLEDAVGFKERACQVHGTQYSELSQLGWYLEKLRDKLEFHLKFQEDKFFPLAQKLLNGSDAPKDGLVKSLEKHIQLIQKDQEDIEYFCKRIRELSGNYTPPKEACITFRLLYSTLEELQDDLKKHHFLEEQYLVDKLQAKINVVQS